MNDQEIKQLDQFIARITDWGEDAYVRYIQQCRHDNCLGADYHMRHGTFDTKRLEAQKAASELLGRSIACADAVRELKLLLTGMLRESV